MAIKSVPISVDWKTIEKKVEEDREEGGGFLVSKSEPEKISYLYLVGFPCVHIEYEHQKEVNKSSMIKRTSTIVEPWLGKGRTNMPNESAAALVKSLGFCQIQDGYYIPWSVVDKEPDIFAEDFLLSKYSLGPDAADLEIKDVCYLSRFIAKLKKKDDSRFLVYNFKGEKVETLSNRLSGDPYYRDRVERNMTRIK